MSINQLLAKAMSTTSEEEAMSCLRMARKKGKTFDMGSSSNSSTAEYKGQGPKYWYDKAAHYYNEAKKREGDLTREQQTQLYRMYKNAEEEKASVRVDNYKLRKELEILKAKKTEGQWKLPVIAFQFVIIMVLVQFIH